MEFLGAPTHLCIARVVCVDRLVDLPTWPCFQSCRCHLPDSWPLSQKKWLSGGVEALANAGRWAAPPIEKKKQVYCWEKSRSQTFCHIPEKQGSHFLNQSPKGNMWSAIPVALLSMFVAVGHVGEFSPVGRIFFSPVG